jgi:hypothetical protein
MQALRLVRSGGLIMWHDFYPDDEIVRNFANDEGSRDFNPPTCGPANGIPVSALDRTELHSFGYQGKRLLINN